MSANPQIPVDPAAKSMQGKYDGRKNNGATKARRKLNSKLGRKPLHEKHLSRNTAAKLFRQFSIQEQCAQLLQSNDLRLRFEVIRYLWDRLEGKPFTAVNPAEQKMAQTVNNDNRLQIAIQQLIPGAKSAKRSKKALSSGTVDHVQTIEAQGVSPAGMDLAGGVE